MLFSIHKRVKISFVIIRDFESSYVSRQPIIITEQVTEGHTKISMSHTGECEKYQHKQVNISASISWEFTKLNHYFL